LRDLGDERLESILARLPLVAHCVRRDFILAPLEKVDMSVRTDDEPMACHFGYNTESRGVLGVFEQSHMV